jgi:hypothetical protein
VNGVTFVKHRENKPADWQGNDKLTNVERLQFNDKIVILANGNEAPDGGSVAETIAEDASFTIHVGDDAKDADGDELSFTGVGGATNGTAEVSSDGKTITFTPDANHNGTAEFTYTITESFGKTAVDIKGVAVAPQSATGKVSITVTAVNDAPTVAAPIPDATAREGQAFSYAVPAETFSDVDAGDTLAYSATLENGSALPSWLSFDAGTLTFSGTPDFNAQGALAVEVTAIDGAGAEASDTFDIEVANVPTLHSYTTDI